ncbi:MAG: TetR/AcrR family transcriptional regulator [Desulfovibrio sp.]|uniref:TetR/AcrR family transcriptional regulator n=1 Tax=Desulfovibrio sp. 7SRBS1 TaxID=3378064 RepID=UPI003B42393C
MSKPNSKDIILATARALFGEYGYTSTTFKKIAESSGLALGLITHYFGSKENLFVQSSLSILDTVQEELEKATSVAPNGLEAVVSFARVYLEFARSRSSDFLILVSCSPYSDLKNSIAKDDMTQIFEHLVNRLREHIEAGQADGSVVQENSFQLANSVFATLVGGVRTIMLASYCPEGFYDATLRYIRRAVQTRR